MIKMCPHCPQFVSLALMLCLSGLAAYRIPTDQAAVASTNHGFKRPSAAHRPDQWTDDQVFNYFAQPVDQAAVGSEPQQNAAQKNSGGPGGQYFQDVYVAQNNPKELEFGHVFENLNDWEQRFEKLNLENLNRQGKVRWGDKNGGYGEHYWDYNHAGQGDDKAESNSEESQTSAAAKDPEESQQTVKRTKRNPDDDVEFISEQAKSSVLNDSVPKHGGNYRRAKESRPKRHQPNYSDLFYDVAAGTIVDQSTGIHYQLQPISSS